jgi:hypothetical protein
MTEGGAWSTSGSGRIAPPSPDQLPGFAKLLGITPEAVARFVAADFYGVQDANPPSARLERLGPAIDSLPEDDLDLVERLLARLEG